MIERNKILQAGKKIIKGLLVSSIVLASAQADFLMTFTDKNGVEENLCVKSYSFSNNLESLHKEVNQKDVYSTEETLTNKTWMGKPVYRKVLLLENFSVPYRATQTSVSTSVLNENTDELVKYYYIGLLNKGSISSFDKKHAYFVSPFKQSDGTNYMTEFIDIAYNYDTNKFSFSVRNFFNWGGIKQIWNFTKMRIIAEYTKTTDTAQTDTNELTTLVHYLPSDSITGEYITKSMDDAGIRFQKNYTYDASTNSCIAPTN